MNTPLETPFRELLLGCGRSRTKKMPSVDGNPNWRGLVTLDIDRQCEPDLLIDISKIPWRLPSDPVRVAINAIHDFPVLGDSVYDEIHAYEVLEHLGQQGNAFLFFSHFSEIWRLLKPDGYLYATVPSRFSSWLWGDPSHTRVIAPVSLLFLDQAEYIRQLDGDRPTGMSDFRSMYSADLRTISSIDNGEVHSFVLQAVKPSRHVR